MRIRQFGALVFLQILVVIAALSGCGGKGNNSDTAPSIPAGLSVSAVSGTQINLSWAASTDDSGTVAGYKVYRDNSVTALKLIATTSTSDMGLLPATQYCYSVSAYDAAGNESSKSSPVCATTQTATGSDTAP